MIGLVYPFYNVAHIETEYIKRTLGQYHICVFLITEATSLQSCSSYGLVTIAVARLMVIINPLRYRVYLTKRKCVAVAVTSWILCHTACYSVYMSQPPPKVYCNICRYELIYPAHIMAFLTVFQFGIPLLIMVTANAWMAYTARTLSRRIFKSFANNIGAPVRGMSSLWRGQKSFAVVTLLVGCFTISWTPMIIYCFVIIAGKVNVAEHEYFSATARIFLYFNYAVNVFIYAGRMTDFRQHVHRDLHFCFSPASRVSPGRPTPPSSGRSTPPRHALNPHHTEGGVRRHSVHGYRGNSRRRSDGMRVHREDTAHSDEVPSGGDGGGAQGFGAVLDKNKSPVLCDGAIKETNPNGNESPFRAGPRGSGAVLNENETSVLCGANVKGTNPNGNGTQGVCDCDFTLKASGIAQKESSVLNLVDVGMSETSAFQSPQHTPSISNERKCCRDEKSMKLYQESVKNSGLITSGHYTSSQNTSCQNTYGQNTSGQNTGLSMLPASSRDAGALHSVKSIHPSSTRDESACCMDPQSLKTSAKNISTFVNLPINVIGAGAGTPYAFGTEHGGITVHKDMQKSGTNQDRFHRCLSLHGDRTGARTNDDTYQGTFHRCFSVQNDHHSAGSPFGHNTFYNDQHSSFDLNSFTCCIGSLGTKDPARPVTDSGCQEKGSNSVSDQRQ